MYNLINLALTLYNNTLVSMCGTIINFVNSSNNSVNLFTKTSWSTSYSWGVLPLYLPYLIFIGVTFLFGFILIFLSKKFGNTDLKLKSTEQVSTYECGFRAFDDARKRIQIHFYIIGLIFLLFDVEIILLIPWVLNAGSLGSKGLFTILFFMLIIVIGFVYEWYIGGLAWFTMEKNEEINNNFVSNSKDTKSNKQYMIQSFFSPKQGVTRSILSDRFNDHLNSIYGLLLKEMWDCETIIKRNISFYNHLVFYANSGQTGNFKKYFDLLDLYIEEKVELRMKELEHKSVAWKFRGLSKDVLLNIYIKSEILNLFVKFNKNSSLNFRETIEFNYLKNPNNTNLLISKFYNELDILRFFNTYYLPEELHSGINQLVLNNKESDDVNLNLGQIFDAKSFHNLAVDTRKVNHPDILFLDHARSIQFKQFFY